MATRTEMHDPRTMLVQDPHGEQVSKGVTGKVRPYLAEPALIAGCGVAGALIEIQHGGLHGDAPVIGMAAAAAGVATLACMVRFSMREGHRRRWRMIGGLAVRFAFALLCFCFEVYGFSCWYDVNTADLPPMTPRHLVTFK
jgi:hypothetical protein